jgi:hypothetical protein
MTKSIEHDLLTSTMKPLAEFVDAWPEIVELCESLLVSAGGLLQSVLEKDSSLARQMILQHWIEFQRAALIHAMTGKKAVSLAVMRTALECSRDFAKLCVNPDLENFWWEAKKDPKKFWKYRKKFRFSESSKFGETLFGFWELCGRYGVHSQFSSAQSFFVEGDSHTKLFRTKKSITEDVLLLVAYGTHSLLDMFDHLQENSTIELADDLPGTVRTLEALTAEAMRNIKDMSDAEVEAYWSSVPSQ